MAVTLDFGKCAACGESNSKTLQRCRACDAELPWAKASKTDQNRAASNPRIGLGDIDWGPMAVQLGGGLIFLIGALICVSDTLSFIDVFPYVDKITMAIGGALWAYGQNME